MKIKLWVTITGISIAFLIFFYIYDFSKNGHDLMIRNQTEEEINILSVSIDGTTIPLSKAWLVPKSSFSNTQKPQFTILPYSLNPEAFMGMSSVVSVDIEKPAFLQVNLKDQSGKITVASCQLTRHKKDTWCLFIAYYQGNETMKCICNDLSDDFD